MEKDRNQELDFIDQPPELSYQDGGLQFLVDNEFSLIPNDEVSIDSDDNVSKLDSSVFAFKFTKNKDVSFGSPIYTQGSQTNFSIIESTNNNISAILPCNLSPSLLMKSELIETDAMSQLPLWLQFDSVNDFLQMNPPVILVPTDYKFSVKYSTDFETYYIHNASITVNK